MNARYVIATSSKVDLGGIDSSTVEKVAAPEYFTKDKKTEKKSSEEAFFKQGEKPEVWANHGSKGSGIRLANRELQKKKVASARAQDQKAVDKSLLTAIKKEQYLASYLASNFSLKSGDKPHEMKF